MISIANEPVLERRRLKPCELDAISTLGAAVRCIPVPTAVDVYEDYVELFGTNGNGPERVSGPGVNGKYVCQALGIRYTL